MGAGIAPGSPALQAGDFFHPTPHVMVSSTPVATVRHADGPRAVARAAGQLAERVRQPPPACAALQQLGATLVAGRHVDHPYLVWDYGMQSLNDILNFYSVFVNKIVFEC